MNKKTQELVPVTPEFGQWLLGVATQERANEIRKKVVTFVRGLQEQKDSIQVHIDTCTAKFNRIDAQLKAVEAGQFTIDKQGKFLFNEADLNND